MKIKQTTHLMFQATAKINENISIYYYSRIREFFRGRGIFIWNHLNLFNSKLECFGQTIFSTGHMKNTFRSSEEYQHAGSFQ